MESIAYQAVIAEACHPGIKGSELLANAIAYENIGK
jgi:hypothetical protein